MTLTVEDGSIVANANTYIDTTDFATYATARGVTIVGNSEELLIQAMDYIESLYFIGMKSTSDQSLQWPRINADIDGYAFDSDAIPQELINGQCEVALAIDGDNGPLIDIPVQTKKEKVGPIEVEYSSGSSSLPINRKIKNALWKLLAGGFGANIMRVSKG